MYKSILILVAGILLAHSAPAGSAYDITVPAGETLKVVPAMGVTAPNWATNEVVNAGLYRRSANGVTYMSVSTGTTAAAGSGPSTNAVFATDNNVTWLRVPGGTRSAVVVQLLSGTSVMLGPAPYSTGIVLPAQYASLSLDLRSVDNEVLASNTNATASVLSVSIW